MNVKQTRFSFADVAACGGDFSVRNTGCLSSGYFVMQTETFQTLNRLPQLNPHDDKYSSFSVFCVSPPLISSEYQLSRLARRQIATGVQIYNFQFSERWVSNTVFSIRHTLGQLLYPTHRDLKNHQQPL
jgi:hypothetical protein